MLKEFAKQMIYALHRNDIFYIKLCICLMIIFKGDEKAGETGVLVI